MYSYSFNHHGNSYWTCELKLLFSNSFLYFSTPNPLFNISLSSSYYTYKTLHSLLFLLPRAFFIYFTLNFIIFCASTHFLLNFSPSFGQLCKFYLLTSFNNKTAPCLSFSVSFPLRVLMFRIVPMFFVHSIPPGM
jgi:hypothetical protein